MFTIDWFEKKGTKQNFEQIILPLFNNKERLRFLEIGCFEGMATVWMLKYILQHKASQIDVVDSFRGDIVTLSQGVNLSNLRQRFEDNIKDFKEKVVIYEGDSYHQLRLLKDNSYDFIYIDGSHYQTDVLEDAIQSYHLVKHGGYMLFDDYQLIYEALGKTYQPKRAIDAFLQVYKDEVSLEFSNWQALIRKK
jgi:predicted O-methyltransferase YrrM